MPGKTKIPPSPSQVWAPSNSICSLEHTSSSSPSPSSSTSSPNDQKSSLIQKNCHRTVAQILAEKREKMCWRGYHSYTWGSQSLHFWAHQCFPFRFLLLLHLCPCHLLHLCQLLCFQHILKDKRKR